MRSRNYWRVKDTTWRGFIQRKSCLISKRLISLRPQTTKIGSQYIFK